MKTMSPAQAEQQLTHVADRFDHWRQTRTTLAEPIPQYLWEPSHRLNRGDTRGMQEERTE